MKKHEYEQMILDAKNEIAGMCMVKLGTTAHEAIRAAKRAEQNIRTACGPLNDLVEAANGKDQAR
ncbi:MAG: hypothetical protein RBU21_20775 [FCB group bacterium]|nr:hypothetical protein [FCB group bacterium]